MQHIKLLQENLDSSFESNANCGWWTIRDGVTMAMVSFNHVMLDCCGGCCGGKN